MKNFFNKLSPYLRNNWPFFAIILLWIILFITNFAYGKYLLGWDSLQTELNPLLAIKRALFSSWQEYQSLGLTAGMGHAADLPRAIVLFIASFVLPQEMIRYTFHMFMVLIAALGMYKLMENTFKSEHTNGNTIKVIAFVGALSYIFNFFVIELMALPFESFSVFAAALPWQILVFLRILTRSPLKKSNW